MDLVKEFKISTKAKNVSKGEYPKNLAPMINLKRMVIDQHVDLRYEVLKCLKFKNLEEVVYHFSGVKFTKRDNGGQYFSVHLSPEPLLVNPPESFKSYEYQFLM